jgi:hypothetical protein
MIHLMGHASELAREGDYIRLPVGVDDVVVMREGGELVAFDNLCPHRGARIFDGFWGNQPPVCSYHGRRATAACVNRYRVIELADWVLVFIPRDDPGEPCEFEGEPAKAIEALLMLGPLALVADHEQVYECPWPVAVENALDWTHVSTVHPDSLGRLQITPVHGGMGPAGSSVEMFRSGAARSLDRLQPNNPLPCDYIHLYMAPFACLSSTRGLTVSLQHYLPGNECTQFLTRLYAPAGTPRGLAVQAHRLNRQVFDEDAAVCARVHPSVPLAERLAPEEWRIGYFRSVWRRP